MTSASLIPQLGRGKYWQELIVGEKGRTFRRTITETDLVNFISATGMLEVIFIDTTHEGAVPGRIVPAALTHALIEGMLFQTAIQGVGLALLGYTLEAKAPVRVGDTIWGLVETDEVKPTSKGNRAVVQSSVTVYNQSGGAVLTYRVKRLLAGRPEDQRDAEAPDLTVDASETASSASGRAEPEGMADDRV